MSKATLKNYAHPAQMSDDLSKTTQRTTSADSPKLILGLDLGTACGYSYAFHTPGKIVTPEEVNLHMGQWDLSAGQYDSGAIRFLRLRYFLSAVQPDLVFYERVRYTPGETPNKMNLHAIVARAATSMEFFGALFGTLSSWCEERDIPCEGISIQDIKRRATNRGNANKSDIIQACNKLFGSDLDHEKYDSVGHDNVADSAFVCLLAMERYGQALSTNTEE